MFYQNKKQKQKNKYVWEVVKVTTQYLEKEITLSLLSVVL